MATPSIATPADDRIGNLCPLAGMEAGSIVDLLRGAGMHPPSESSRQDLSALTMRPDVTLYDACESAEAALHQAAAVLLMLEIEDSADLRIIRAAGAARTLLGIAQGHLGVMHAGISPRQQPMGT